MRRDSGMLHPVALAALAVLVLNDHVWKARYPGWVTGKLSDVAGLIVFPLVACALVRVVVRTRAERVLAAAIAATMIGFALVKLWSPATHACAVAMGALQAPLSPSPVTIVRDPTDLLALPFALVAWWLPRSTVLRFTEITRRHGASPREAMATARCDDRGVRHPDARARGS